jgi:hypothetical protein
MSLFDGPVLHDLDDATTAAFGKKIGTWLQQSDVAADPEITAQYVMVMVSNKKDRNNVATEMEMFLGAASNRFTTWCVTLPCSPFVAHVDSRLLSVFVC